MNLRQFFPTAMVTAVAVLGVEFGLSRGLAAQPDANEGVSVLTRGPVHEAFAAIVNFNPEPGPIVSKEPPDAIDELPPDQKPAGANVAWIPGYWAWDDEQNDFLWVSGTWRVLPPGRQWVPGYWSRAQDGYQWTSGYWADSQSREIEYLPEPPDTIEAGPNVDAPSAEHVWLPGCWIWHQNRYAWRPGYWSMMQQNWDWIPAHYVWTPGGYVFVDGYWDCPVARRGVLFAPVLFDGGDITRQGFYYSPAAAISLAVFTNHLFLRPRYRHYYFGDYYAASYANAGFTPWFSFQSSRLGYDPFYARQRWQNRNVGEWEQSVRADFQNRRDHEDARPPRTLAAQQALKAPGVQAKEQGLLIATSLTQLSQSKDSTLRFEHLSRAAQQEIGQRGKAIQKFRTERQTLEAKAGIPSGDKPAKLKLPQSSIVAKANDEVGADHAPPKADHGPKPDLQVQPKAKTAGNRPTLGDDRQPAPKVGPRPAPKLEPKPAPKTDPIPLPKPAPKVEPKPAPKPAPKIDPQPVPRPGPKVEPQPKPKPAPKVDPKPAPQPPPRVEPKPPPQSAPKVEPQPKPKAKPERVPPSGAPA